MSNVIGLIAEGDSVTYGVVSYFYGYFGGAPSNISAQLPRREVRMFTGNIIGSNMSVSGSRLNDPASGSSPDSYLATRTANVDTLIAPTSSPLRTSGLPNTRPTRKYILSVMVGTNPGNSEGTGSNPTTTTNELATYLAARATAGFNALIVCTIPDRGDNIIANFWSSYQQPFNSILRGSTFLNQFSVPCVCADLASTSEWGGSGVSNNATYFNADKIHPLSALYALVQSTYNAAVAAAIALL